MKKSKKIVLLLILIVLSLIIYIVYTMSTPTILSYEEIKSHLTIQEYEGDLSILCDFDISLVNYLAKSEGTQYIGLAHDGISRCYKQSLQVTSNKWQLYFGEPSVIYKRELTEYGTKSGESTIINNDGTITIVLRYDTEVYYRDLDGQEYLLWNLE